MVFGKRLGGGDTHTSAPSIIHQVWKTICALFSVFKTDKRPLVPVEIEGKTFLSLMDSGSGLTLMSYKAFKKLKPVQNLHKSRVRLTAANGGQLIVKGYVKLRYRLGTREVLRRTLIVDGLQTQSLIGVDTMAEENITIDHGARKVIMKPKAKCEVGYSTKGFCVLPMCQKVVSLVNTRLSEGLVLAKGPRVPEGVTGLKNGRLMVQVQNNKMWPIWYKRGAEICAIRSVNSADLAPDKINTTSTVPKHVSRNLPETTLNDILKNVPSIYKEQYKDLFRNYADCLALSPDEVGHTTVLKHHIELKDKNLISASAPRRIAKHLFGVAKDYVDKMYAQGIIRPSRSPFSAPLMIVKKPNVSDDPNIPNVLKWRAVCDWRQLNSNTVADKYPMRNLYELLDEVSNGKLYSVIDLANGFYTQELTESSKAKTAFSLAGYGHWEMCRSGMGLTNSPAAFQRLLEFITRGLQKVFVYLDDIAVVGQTHPEHLRQLKEVFERFRKYGLKARLSKLQIATGSISYLGHRISAQDGIKPGLLKVKAIDNWRPPTTVSQVREYLGLCGWYRRMVPKFSEIASPLTALTRKDSTWKGGILPQDAQNSFLTLKKILVAEPCLSPVQWDREMIVTCDGSSSGYGAKLSFIDKNGTERVCAYASRATKPSEKNYSPFKMEASAMLFACTTFKCYLLGKPFLIRTDHKPLENVSRVRGPGLDNIYAQLQEFLPFRVEHYPGAKMQTCGVDGLSRGGVTTSEEKAKVAIPTKQKWPYIQCKGGHTFDEEREVAISSKNKSRKNQVFKTSQSQPSRTAVSKGVVKPVSQNKLGNAGRNQVGLVEKETSLQLNWSADNVKSLQTQDKYLKSLACWLAFGLKPDSRDLQKWVKVQSKSAVFDKNGILGINSKGNFRILAPLQIRQTLLELSHDRSGHWGHKKMYEILHPNWTWPKMRAQIENYAKSCDKCQGANPAYNMKPVPLEPLPEATHFGARLHIDLVGKLPLSGNNFNYLLVCVDAFSGLVHLTPICGKESDTIAQALITGFFAQHGYPLTLNSDRGSEFCSDLMISLTKKLNIKRALSSSAHPISNGLVERANRSIIGLIRKTIEANNEWAELCPSLASAMNCAPHSTKRFSPFMIAYNRRPNVLVDLLLPNNYSERTEAEAKLSLQIKMHRAVREWAREAFVRQKREYDKRTINRSFLPKDYVWVTRPHSGTLFQKFQPQFMGGYQVVKSLSHNCYELVHLKTLRRLVVHVNRIKRGTFREQIYAEQIEKPKSDQQKNDTNLNENVSVPVTKPLRRSPRFAQQHTEFDDEDDDGGGNDAARRQPPWQPPSPAPSHRTSNSRNSLTGSSPSNVQSQPAEPSLSAEQAPMSFEGEMDGADLHSEHGAGSRSANGKERTERDFLSPSHSPSSPTSSSSSNATDQQSPVTAQQQSQDELERELVQVRDRRALLEQTLGGREGQLRLESSPPQPPPEPEPPRRSTRTRRRNPKFFGKEWSNAIYSF